jgi:hypothetical protein
MHLVATNTSDPCSRAFAVQRVASVIFAKRIVNDREEPHHASVRSGVLRHEQSVVAHAPPMRDSMQSPRTHRAPRHMRERMREKQVFMELRGHESSLTTTEPHDSR